jgi:hypothetical protein
MLVINVLWYIILYLIISIVFLFFLVFVIDWISLVRVFVFNEFIFLFSRFLSFHLFFSCIFSLLFFSILPFSYYFDRWWLLSDPLNPNFCIFFSIVLISSTLCDRVRRTSDQDAVFYSYQQHTRYNLHWLTIWELHQFWYYFSI